MAVVAVAAMVLVGCATKSPDEIAYVAARDHAECAGFDSRSAEYRGCRQTIDRQRDQARRQKIALVVQQASKAYSDGYARAAAAQQANRPLICRPNPYQPGTTRCEQGY